MLIADYAIVTSKWNTVGWTTLPNILSLKAQNSTQAASNLFGSTRYLQQQRHQALWILQASHKVFRRSMVLLFLETTDSFLGGPRTIFGCRDIYHLSTQVHKISVNYSKFQFIISQPPTTHTQLLKAVSSTNTTQFYIDTRKWGITSKMVLSPPRKLSVVSTDRRSVERRKTVWLGQ
jgi:hypothetical protein